MRFLMTTACLIATTATVMAEPLKPATVPQDAKWVIHLNYDALQETELVQRVRDQRSDVVKTVRQWMQEQYGISPQQDLHGLTMFSTSYESHTGAAVLSAEFNPQKVQSELESLRDVQKNQVDGMTMYTWDVEKNAMAAARQTGRELGIQAPQQNQQQQNQPAQQADNRQAAAAQEGGDKKKMVTAVLVDNSHLVFAPSKETAKSVAMLVKGEAPSLEGQNSKLITDTPPGTFLYGSAIQLSEIAQNRGAFPVLRQHEHVMMVLGEREGKLFEKIVLNAKNEDVARGMEAGMQGLNALVEIAVADSERLTKLLGKNVSITRDGTVVTADWEGDLDSVVNALDELSSRIMEQLQAQGQAQGQNRNQGQNLEQNRAPNRNPNPAPNRNPNPNQR